MPASACCLALSAEALRRLCGGVPIAGRPMLGSTACITEGLLMPDSVHPRPLSGAYRPGPVPRGISSHGRLSPDGRLSPAPAPEGARGPVGGTMRLGASAARSVPRRRPLRHVFCYVFCFRPSSAFALRRTGHVFTGGPASLLLDWSRRPDRRRRRPAGRGVDGPARRPAAAACEAVSGTCERQSPPAA
jgi:hypothetical protein